MGAATVHRPVCGDQMGAATDHRPASGDQMGAACCSGAPPQTAHKSADWQSPGRQVATTARTPPPYSPTGAHVHRLLAYELTR